MYRRHITMSSQHLHLLLNHVPVLVTIFSVIMLGVGLWLRNETLNRTALVGFIISALITIPVFLSGEGAEEAVEHLPGVTEALIERHEEAADLSFWIIEALGIGALAILGFSLKKREMQRSLLFVLLLVGIGSSVSVGYTANLGGEIRHTEIRSTSANNSAPTSVQPDSDGDDD